MKFNNMSNCHFSKTVSLWVVFFLSFCLAQIPSQQVSPPSMNELSQIPRSSQYSFLQKNLAGSAAQTSQQAQMGQGQNNIEEESRRIQELMTERKKLQDELKQAQLQHLTDLESQGKQQEERELNYENTIEKDFRNLLEKNLPSMYVDPLKASLINLESGSVEQARSNLSSFQTTKENMQNEVGALETQLQNLRQAENKFESQISAEQKASDLLKMQRGQEKTELTAIVNEVQELENVILNLTQEITQKNDELKSLQDNISGSRQQLQDLEKQKYQLQTEKLELFQSFQEIASSTKEMLNEKRLLQQEISHLEDSYEKLRVNLDTSERRNDVTKNNLRTLEGENEQAVHDLQWEKEQLDGRGQEYTKLVDESNNLKEQTDSLEQEIARDRATVLHLLELEQDKREAMANEQATADKKISDLQNKFLEHRVVVEHQLQKDNEAMKSSDQELLSLRDRGDKIENEQLPEPDLTLDSSGSDSLLQTIASAVSK
mmetsp:Transcript_35986/g.40947  ORF Transcript_35986/g.40947 Transcript_35986/m.40947 type:complete len:490 (-) Transcript_35986:1058-2527(-)